jgi:hypothetical protein
MLLASLSNDKGSGDIRLAAESESTGFWPEVSSVEGVDWIFLQVLSVWQLPRLRGRRLRYLHPTGSLEGATISTNARQEDTT